VNGVERKGQQPAVDFINVLWARFLYEILAPKNTSALRSFSRYVLAKKSTFVQKTRALNVDEIDTWSQFHQR
jgi:hypothetical protein